ncbi:MAG: CpaF family protein [Candidatus Dormibacter sp.]
MQRKAEEGQTPASGDDAKAAAAATQAERPAAAPTEPEPPTFHTPDVSPGPDTSALTGWQVRHAPPSQRPDAPAAAAPPAPLNGPGSAASSSPAIAGTTAPSSSATPADTAPQGQVAGAAPFAPRGAPPLMMRTGAASGAGAEAPARQSSLLNRTALARGPMSKPGGNNLYAQLRSKVHQRLVEELAGNTATAPPEQVRQRIGELVNELVAEQNLSMTRQDKLRVIETVIDDALGLGPLEGLLHDPEITEIMINKHDQIYVEQHGKLTLSPVRFETNDQLMQVIDRIVSSIGRRVDESSPMVDARLKDGSRVNVIIPPLALRGPTLTIRKFAKEAFTVADLVNFGTITEDMVRFLRACVRGRLNVVVSGGTGSGKTTTLNLLSSFIPEDERIVIIEDSREVQLQRPHVVQLEARPGDAKGKGAVSIRDLFRATLRMRPDRIVVGEIRGGEALDLVQAMTSGHGGCLSTVHATYPSDTMTRLETMTMMSDVQMPLAAMRVQLASAIDIIVQTARLTDGSRRVTHIAEVRGYEPSRGYELVNLFERRFHGRDSDGAMLSVFEPTGELPSCTELVHSYGMRYPEEVYEAARARAMEHDA